MKNIIIAAFLIMSNLLNAQKIKVEEGEINAICDKKPVISKVFGNKVYLATFNSSKVTITGFDATSMKQSSVFTTEKLKNLVAKGVIFLENKCIVLYKEKFQESPVRGDVFAYDGKILNKNMSLTDFIFDDWSLIENFGQFMVSENGKYFMIANSNIDRKPTFDYAIYSDELKLVKKGNAKLPAKYNAGRILKLILSNTANIGILAIEDFEGSASTTYFILKKDSKQIEEIKTLSSEYKGYESKVITAKSGYYIGGLTGIAIPKTYTNYLHGVFGIKLDLNDLSIVYSNFTNFSESQATEYNTELFKWTYLSNVTNIKYPEGLIHNDYVTTCLDGFTLDKNDNLVFGISSEKIGEGLRMADNLVICQFRLTIEGSISNYTIIPRRQTANMNATSDFYYSDYFYSSVVCSGDYIISIFNDGQKNLDNLTDMNKNVENAGKKSMLVGVETNIDGVFKKFALLPNDKSVLIITFYTEYIDSNITFAFATRDKGNAVLLKISSVE